MTTGSPTGDNVTGLFGGMGNAVLRLKVEPVDKLLEPLAVFGKVDGVRAGPQIGMPASSRAAAIFSSVCPPSCTTTPCMVPACDSRRITSITSSSVSGSKYNLSECRNPSTLSPGCS